MLSFDRPHQPCALVRLALIAGLMMSPAVKHSLLEAETPMKGESEYLIKNWSVDEGLPSSSVYSIKQTADGFLWLRTKTGLVRFDGIRFVEVFPELQNPNFVHGSAGGVVWISDKKGGLYHLDHGRLEPVNFGSELRAGYYGVFVDREGISWITQNGFTRPWKDGAWLTDAGLAALGKKPPSEKFQILNQLPNGGWLGQTSGQFGIWRDGEFTPVSHNSDGPAAVGEFYASGRRKAAWILERPVPGGYSLRSVSYSGDFTEPVLLPWRGSIFGSYVEEDRAGNVWVTSATHGLVRYGTDGTWELFNPSAVGNRRNFTTEMARCILQDQEGNIWVGTDGGGIFRLSRRTFRTYGSADGLRTENLYAVAPSRTGAVWMGTHSSVGEALFKWEDGNITFQPGMGFYGWSAHEEPSGVVWVGDFENGLHSLRDGTVTSVENAPRGVYAICDDGKGGIWAGGLGLCRVNSERCERISSMPEKTISSLACEPDGTLWIGTLNGGVYQRRGDQLTQFTSSEGLPHNEVLSLYLDKGNSLWVGTRKGMSRWKDGRFVSLTRQNGLVPEAVSGMAEDNFGNFWIHSPAGIARILRSELDQFLAGDIKRIFTIGYGRDDGLVTSASTSGTQARVCLDKAGRVWFATLKGAAVADPAIMPLNTNPPPIVIEEVWSNGKLESQPMVSSILRANDAQEFRPGVARFTIRYTANSLTAPEKLRFRYRLEGLSPEWVEAGPRREVVYDRLAHGSYRFEVTACNNHGLWNDHGAILAFTVLPFFWETRWFQLAVVVAILAAVGLAVRQISTRHLRRRLVWAEQEAAVEKERARISRDMHDDLGARLTKISLLGELANRSLTRPAEAQEHLQRLSGLATETSESLGELIWTIKPANDSLRSLAGHLCQQTDEYLRETEVRCRFDLPENLPDTWISSDLRREVVLSVREALNNVVKHSSASEARLSVQMQNGEMLIEISDNGKGLPIKTVPRSAGGNGLANLRHRLERFGGSCEISNQVGGGVRVVLRVSVEVTRAR